MEWKNNEEKITLRKCDIYSTLKMAFPNDEVQIRLMMHSLNLVEIKTSGNED